MNKSWLLLIIGGITLLLITIGFDAYQNLSGAKSNINTALVDYNDSVLLEEETILHLKSDTRFQEFIKTP